MRMLEHLTNHLHYKITKINRRWTYSQWTTISREPNTKFHIMSLVTGKTMISRQSMTLNSSQARRDAC